MSYHQGAEGGAMPKERRKDGSPNKDLDDTMDPDMKRGQLERAESISSGNLSMKSGESMDIPISFKGADSLQNKGPGEVPCDVCEVQAVKFCQTCTLSYCGTHVKKHYTLPKN
nr:uncharacterized protein LOC111958497 [Salvelinus alpinus]